MKSGHLIPYLLLPAELVVSVVVVALFVVVLDFVELGVVAVAGFVELLMLKMPSVASAAFDSKQHSAVELVAATFVAEEQFEKGPSLQLLGLAMAY